MVDKIEYLESLVYTGTNDKLTDGFMCIHMVLDIIATGNDELIKALENGR